MLNVVNEIRALANQKLEEKKVTEFKNDLYKDFHKTMLTKGYKSMTDCSTSSSICKEITFKDNTKTKFEIDLLAKQIEFNGYKYVLPYSMEVNFLNNYDNECNNSCVSIKEEDNYLSFTLLFFRCSSSLYDVPYALKDDACYPSSDLVSRPQPPGGDSPSVKNPESRPQPPAATSLLLYEYLLLYSFDYI